MCTEMYRVTSDFPERERFGITSQIQRASVSVPSNIAEGHSRSSNADFTRFLYMSLGSVRELESLLEVSLDLGYLDSISEQIDKLQEIAKMITGLINFLNPES